MITIQVSNNYCKVLTTDLAIHAYLDTVFSEYVDGYFFSPMFKNKIWDGKAHAYSRLTGRFKPGLLTAVVKQLKAGGYETCVVDQRDTPKAQQPINPRLLYTLDESFRELRENQLTAVSIMEQNPIGVVKAATNAGKTEMFTEFLRRKNLTAVIICTRKELFHQTAARLRTRLGVDIGQVGDGLKKVEPITVVMPGSVVKNVLLKGNKNKVLRVSDEYLGLTKVDILLLDECQNLGDSRVEYFVDQCQAYYRYAFSGTPFMRKKAGNLNLKSHFGEIIMEITNRELIAQGVSSVPSCYFIKDSSGDLEVWTMT